MGGFIVRTSGTKTDDGLTIVFIAGYRSLFNLLVVSKSARTIFNSGMSSGESPETRQKFEVSRLLGVIKSRKLHCSPD